MKGFLKTLLVAGIAYLTLGTGASFAANPNLITNGNFEASSTTATGWTKTSGSKLRVYSIHDNLDPTIATNYHQVLGMNVKGDQDAAAQTVSGLTAGKQYALTFDFAARAGTTAAQNVLDVYVGGVKVISGFSVAGAPGINDHPIYTWKAGSYKFTAANSNPLQIEFKSVGAATTVSTSYLDNVTLKAVPEASTMLLFGGLFLLGGLALRKRSATLA